MSAIQINRESLPLRCEICHQSDCFNPISNYCQRCAQYLQFPAVVAHSSESQSQASLLNIDELVILFTIAATGAVLLPIALYLIAIILFK